MGYAKPPPEPTASTPASTPTSSSGSGTELFGKSTYGDSSGVAAATSPGNFLATSDPRDFMYGRDPNYAANTAATERATTGALSNQINSEGQSAATAGQAYGQQIYNYTQGAATAGQQNATGIDNSANAVYNQAAGLQGRQGAQANYQQQDSVLQAAKNNAAALGQAPTTNSAISGLAALNPASVNSAAQAQLQSGLNQSEASNLALARSGSGWGASASAQNQAIQQNAAAGQQAANSSAQLSAQEGQFAQQQAASNLTAAGGLQNAQNAQVASNLNNAATLQGSLGSQYGQQATTNANLQEQTMVENDQAQNAMYGTALGAANNAAQDFNTASGIGAAGMVSGTQAAQAGETLGMQGTQQAAGIYGQGEQEAGLNMSAQQQGDLAREGGLLTNEGIQSGVAISNQNAINSGWGTALSTAGTIGAAAIASDANAKTGVTPLDGGAPKPPAPAMPQAQPPKNTGLATGIQVGGAVAGGAIGSAIAPGIGTAIGGALGSIAGKAIGGLVTSDIDAKGSVQTIDPGAPSSTPMGYGQVDPSASTQAGVANAFQAGREDAAKAAGDASAAADLKAQAAQGAQASMLKGAAGNLQNIFGGNQGMGAYEQFAQMGRPGLGPYGMQQAPSWNSMQVTSDVHSKKHIEALHSENQALRAALTYPPSVPAPTQAMLNRAAADQDSSAPGAQISYPPASAPPSQDMLNQAAADQSGGATQPYRSAYVTSDENEKEQSAALDMVDEAPGYSYEYKDPARHGYGQHFGPMAQDLLKTPAGASTVAQTPDGTLAVNTPRLTLVNTAALHSMHQENQDQFEKLKSDIDRLKNKSPADRKIERDLDRADQQYTAGLSGRPAMSPADAALAAQLDSAGDRYTTALSGRGARAPSPSDAALSAQLDAAGDRYTRALSSRVAPVSSAADAALSSQLDAADARYSAPMAYGRTVMPTVSQPDYEALDAASGRGVPTARYELADNGADGASGGQEPYMPEATPASGHHFWEVPDHSNGGRYVPIWDLPASGWAPAQQLRAQGAQIGRG